MALFVLVIFCLAIILLMREDGCFTLNVLLQDIQWLVYLFVFKCRDLTPTEHRPIKYISAPSGLGGEIYFIFSC